MNGYCRIVIDGQEVGLKFAYECNKWFFTSYMENLDTYTEGESLSTIGFAKLFHCAYRNNCALKDVKISLSVENFYDWICDTVQTDAGREKFAEVVNIWSETQSTKDIISKIEELNGNEEKKKTLTS